MVSDQCIAKLRSRLEAIDQAIEALTEDGQSFSISGAHSVTRARLAELSSERRRLIKLLTRLLSGQSSLRVVEYPCYG